MKRNCLVLTQSRENSEYNDFVGRFYHFPNKYIGQFRNPPIEFVYYEPTKSGSKGVYFGYGKITTKPTEDKRESGHYFVEISDYKPFMDPVSVKGITGKLREADSSHYNPQNAVRKISAELLDEICLDGKIRLNFQVDAHLIKVLGEQLIASEKIGILELIKNAYDAGASYCRVRIEKVPNLVVLKDSEYEFSEYKGPVIVIEDDGAGMSREIIENGWLRPASTLKFNLKTILRAGLHKKVKKTGAYSMIVDQLKKASGGRVPLGEKGVGRFATHRLGRYLEIRTKVAELDYEYVLKIDWDTFDEAAIAGKSLGEVGVHLSRESLTRKYGKKKSGTQIIIYGGREGFEWSKENIKEDLNSSILSINSPQTLAGPDKNSFHVYLECPQIGELPKDNLLKGFTPTFSFEGRVSEDGVLNYTLRFSPPSSVPMGQEVIKKSFNLQQSESSYWKTANTKVGKSAYRKPECGPFKLHLNIWYRTDPWIIGPSKGDFITYLTRFGGISIFRDGINVFPAEWGANTDWLQLSKRHIKQGFRMSYYNFIGNLEIDQMINSQLIDKTNREGLIENTAFKDLTHLVNIILTTVIENEFIGKRNRYTALISKDIKDPEILTRYAKQGASLMEDIGENYPLKKDPYNILGEFGEPADRKERLINLANSLKNLQKSIKLIEQSQEFLTEQAGYGLAVAVSVHELAKITGNFYTGVSQLLKSGKMDKSRLVDLQQASASLQTELKRLSPLRAIRNEPNLSFSVRKAVNYVSEVFRNRLGKQGIQLEVVSRDDFQIHGRYGAVIQMFSNLMDNSSYWLDDPKLKNKKIKIKVDAKRRTILFADNGPGIHDVILPYLFQAGQSLKVPASGLGLYICKYYMQSMHGDIRLAVPRERISGMSGAQFILDFHNAIPDSDK